jgi:hypothetical protein
MLEAVALTFGMVVSFVLTGVTRNHRLRRPNPPMLSYLGYVLVGLCACVSAMALGYAGYGLATGQPLLG